jgi:hypothetical protein
MKVFLKFENEEDNKELNGFIKDITMIGGFSTIEVKDKKASLFLSAIHRTPFVKGHEIVLEFIVTDIK